MYSKLELFNARQVNKNAKQRHHRGARAKGKSSRKKELLWKKKKQILN